MAAYMTPFKVLFNHLRDLYESYKLSCFITGLKDEIRLPIKLLKAHTLNFAFGLAKIKEEYIHSSRKNDRPVYQSNSAPIGSWIVSGGSGYFHGNVRKEFLTSKGFSPKNTLPIKKVSANEMKQMRENGLCSYCEEK